MTNVKQFTRKGAVRKNTAAIAYVKPDGTTGYTDSRNVAREFNRRFGHLILPAREEKNGAA